MVLPGRLSATFFPADEARVNKARALRCRLPHELVKLQYPVQFEGEKLLRTHVCCRCGAFMNMD